MLTPNGADILIMVDKLSGYVVAVLMPWMALLLL
jgi:hypothetical protein